MRALRTCAFAALLAALPANAHAQAAQASLDTTSTGALHFVFWPRTRTLAETLARDALRAPFPGIERAVLAQGTPLTIYITPDERTFSRQTGGLAPEWGAGVAFPRENVIVLPGYTSERGGAQDLRNVLRHELAHVALQRRLGEVRVPRWFTEGYATWSARQLDADAGWLLRLAFVFERAPALDSLELAWPGAETDARVAYLLSATAVEYLYSLGPPETFDRFLDAWAAHGNLEQALRGEYRLSSAQFERIWRKEVKSRYGWLLFLTQGAVLGLFFTVTALVLFVIRRRRDRRKLAQLRANEPPDAPAFWLEPPEAAPEEQGGEDGRSP